MKPSLTYVEFRTLCLIANEINKHGVQPSYREIADRFDYSSAASITNVMQRLEYKGLVTRIGLRAVRFDWRRYLKHPLNPKEFLTTR
jgi:DNA-binding MarR family transcriptional regulator